MIELPHPAGETLVAAILGPTGVGKSAVGLEVADLLGGEVISADSMQVYRWMDIGTAKLAPGERVASSGRPVPHHLIDIVEPGQNFSVADYQREASRAIAEIARRGKLPLLVGGSGLYVRAVLDGYTFLADKPAVGLRAALAAEARRENGPATLYARLQEVDPVTARRLHPHDLKRVIRALEVYLATGKRLSETATRENGVYRTALVGLWMERQELYARLDRRVEEMLKKGLLEEVRRLRRLGISREHTCLQAVGYKELVAYLEGELTLEAAVGLIKRNTRRLAKRQMTWFKRDPRLRWHRVSDDSDPGKIAQEIIGTIRRIFNIPVEWCTKRT